MKVEHFTEALLEVDRIKAREIIQAQLNPKYPFDVIENIVVPSLEYIGSNWEKGSVALSQVYMSGRIVEDLVDEILPSTDHKRISQPIMAIAVLDDFHLLGKRIIYSVLRASGYSLLDYGRVTTDELVEKIISDSVEIMLISTLMLPSAIQVKTLKQKLLAANYKVKLVVGGAPFRFDPLLADEVGADATAANAKETLKLISDLVGGKHE